MVETETTRDGRRDEATRDDRQDEATRDGRRDEATSGEATPDGADTDETAQGETTNLDSVERHLESRLPDHPAPGVSVALVDGGETVYAAGFGERDAERGAPATAETIYGIGSATKPITATAVLQLVAEGELSLSEPVSTFLPAFGEAPGEPITVHDLLSHTSGMPPDDLATVLLAEGAMGIDLPAGPTADDWPSFSEHVAETASERQLDGRFRYYNTGYTALSRLIELVSGTSFRQYVRESVLDPVGAERTTFDGSVIDGTTDAKTDAGDTRTDAGDAVTDVMRPYRQTEDGRLQPASFPDSPLLDGPGGLLASVRDVAAFLGAFTGEAELLSAELREQLFEPVGVMDTLVDGTERGYGYGWETRQFGDDELLGHSGGTGVSSAYVGLLRERGVGVVVACNAMASPSPTTLATELLAVYTGRDPDRLLPERAIERKARAVTGQYESTSGLRAAAVEWDGDRLQLEFQSPIDRETVAFRPASPDPDDYTFLADDDEERRRAVFEFHDECDGEHDTSGKGGDDRGEEYRDSDGEPDGNSEAVTLHIDWSVLHRVDTVPDGDSERTTDDPRETEDEATETTDTSTETTDTSD
jgi:CubicO group peptidase (beta-lactamase class C family)